MCILFLVFHKLLSLPATINVCFQAGFDRACHAFDRAPDARVSAGRDNHVKVN